MISNSGSERARRRLAEQAHAEGHWIGNHTFTHGGPLGRREDPGHAEAEIGRTEALIGALPRTDIRTGVQRFVDWYRTYYRA